MLLVKRTLIAKGPRDTREARRTATRARILEAAWALARRDGLAAITLREVADAVGMRAPSLYKHFSSKNAMYDAMYAQGVQQLAERLSRRRQSADPRVTLRNRVHAFVDFCVEDPARYQIMLERPIPGFEPTPESYALALAALGGTRADLEATGVRGPRALDLMRAITTGIVSLQVANEPSGRRWTRLVDEVLDMFFLHYDHRAGRSGRVRGRTDGGR